jgi:hypothetical protein
MKAAITGFMVCTPQQQCEFCCYRISDDSLHAVTLNYNDYMPVIKSNYTQLPCSMQQAAALQACWAYKSKGVTTKSFALQCSNSNEHPILCWLP